MILLLFAQLIIPIVSTAIATPKSTNDPLRALALSAPKPQNGPVCCLKPLISLEPVEEKLLLSFEDWKAKQLSMQQQETKQQDKESTGRPPSTASQLSSATDVDIPPDETSLSSQSNLDSSTQDVSDTEPLSPHFRVPLTDRFNYASLECSARVHLSHRSARSPASILSSKRDRYMLSPCSSPESSRKQGEPQFVVVELCADIRIDTVQLANFEFFSGVFKDFTVSVAKTYTTDAEGWVIAGTYRAKNHRGVQSFHPPTSLRDFYRYIRIDFHSHYGNEYYCPISLLHVYGLTHLEEWKWDIWEAESRAKRDISEAKNLSDALAREAEPNQAPLFTSAPIEQSPPSRSAEEKVGNDPVLAPTEAPQSSKAREIVSEAEARESMTGQIIDRICGSMPNSMESYGNTAIPNPSDSAPHEPLSQSSTTALSSPISNWQIQPPNLHVMRHRQDTTSTGDIRDQVASTLLSSTQPDKPSEESISSSAADLSGSFSDTSTIFVTDASTTTAYPTSESSSVSSTTTASTFSVGAYTPVPVLPPIGGESIYRTIMNRLTALETNHTLYTRYIEEQVASMREVLKRLGEDIGRLEGIGNAQAQTYHRTVREWERQRQKLEVEYSELVSRVNYLADEIVLEKRLGIAQLCLLLTVLLFMALTRGSRGEGLLGMDHRFKPVISKSMKEWGRRTISFSGDWVSRIRSQSPSFATRGEVGKHENGTVKFEFPTSPQTRLRTSSPLAVDARGRTRSLTPTRNLLYSHRLNPSLSSTSLPSAPTNLTPSTSHYSAFAPRSAKKWARSAHLHVHQDRRARRVRRLDDVRDDLHGQGRWRPRGAERQETEQAAAYLRDDGDVDGWVDTDVDIDVNMNDGRLETGDEVDEVMLGPLGPTLELEMLAMR